MNPERWQRVKTIFTSALELPPEEQLSFVHRACGEDAELQEEVQSLLRYEPAIKTVPGVAPADGLRATQPADQGSGDLSASVQLPGDVANLHLEIDRLLARSGSDVRDEADDSTGILIGTTISHYRILKRLGWGGIGVVYKAEDMTLGRYAAVKLLADAARSDPGALERFKREARTASLLSHPGICTIYEFGEHEGRLFLAMEFIEGCSLRQFPQRDGSLESLTELIVQAAAALAAAHSAGIVHRDVKPENMMVRSDGHLKLVDFGLARFAPSLPQSGFATAPGMRAGTLAYMSPEQLRAEEVSSASDIFSLGIVLYEFASGRHPFVAGSQAEISTAILTEMPPSVREFNPEVSPVLNSLILQMLHKDPRLRPTAAEAYAALKGATTPSMMHQSRASSRTTKPGREKERTELWKAFRCAVKGRGFLACFSGEPGIGKTTVVESFLEELAGSGEPCFIARGRCSERLAGSDAYLPMLEALESLLRGPSFGTATRTMKALAPAWYSQVAFAGAPGVTGGEARSTVAQPVSQEQLKRQLSAFFRELSTVAPVILFLDDLHWADASTIDLIAYLATKFDQLRLLILSTYRPSDARLSKHPFLSLKQDLEGRGACKDTELEFLSPEEIADWLRIEFAGSNFPASLAGQLHRRTEGNPLFLVNLVEYLRGRSIIAQRDGRWILEGPIENAELKLPSSIRSMIARKTDNLSEPDRRLLITASVQGYEFDSAILAEVLPLDAVEIEEQLDVLEGTYRLVQNVGEMDLPDRTASSHYRFVHVLYQDVFYNALLPARRRPLSSSVAAALERHYGSETPHISAQMAVLWEAAREPARSSHYFLIAAQRAAQLSAHREAVSLSRRGLQQLQSLPEDAEWSRVELSFQTTLASSLFLVKGYGDPEVEPVFRRAQELAYQTGRTEQLVGILRGLSWFHETRGQMSVGRGLAERAAEVARQSGDPGLLIVSHHLSGDISLWTGNFVESRALLQQGIDLYDSERDRSLPERFGAYDLNVGCRMFLAHDLWYLGYPDQALASAQEAVRWAQQLNHPYSRAAAGTHCAWIHVRRGEPGMALERALENRRFAEEHHFPFHIAHAKVVCGWARSEEGKLEQGIAELREGIDLYRSIGAITEHPLMAMQLASALVRAGDLEAASEAIETALTGFDGSPLFCDAELPRWNGEICFVQGFAEKAEPLYRSALENARRQQAKSLELRAALGLSRVMYAQGRKAEARELIVPIYSSFTEGLNTADLIAARNLMDSLA